MKLKDNKIQFREGDVISLDEIKLILKKENKIIDFNKYDINDLTIYFTLNDCSTGEIIVGNNGNFDKLNLIVKEKREWTPWKMVRIFYDDLEGYHIYVDISERCNGKKVQLKYGNIRAEATCNDLDKFNYEKGFKLARARLIIKLLESDVKVYAKRM